MPLAASVNDWLRDNPGLWFRDNAFWLLVLIAVTAVGGVAIGALNSRRAKRREQVPNPPS